MINMHFGKKKRGGKIELPEVPVVCESDQRESSPATNAQVSA